MVKADEIRDRESLRAWLEGRSHAESVLVAVRSALRVAPIAWARQELGERERDIEGLAICRALLIAGMAVKSPTPAITDAAHIAFAAAYSGADKNAAEGDVYAHTRYAAAEAVFVAGNSSAADYAVSAVARAVLAVRASVAESFANRGSEIWEQIREDGQMLEAREQCLDAPLWSIPAPDWFRAAESEFRPRWQADPAFAFWLRWWDGVVSGDQVDWALQEKVALIPNEVWEGGPGAVAAATRAIEDELRAADEPDLRRQVAVLSTGKDVEIAKVRQMFLAHRRELPPTFDAVLGFITLEIERLQRRNYRDDDDADETRRQIGVLTTLYRSVEALKALVPKTAEMSTADAQKAEKLSRLFVRKFKAWPRANSDELVDSTYRVALVGATTVMLPMIGVTAPYAFAAGIVVFGGKKMVDAVKFARDAIKP